MLRAVQPIEPPSSDCDPYELAHEALVALTRIHSSLLHRGNLVEDAELVAERIKQLATGPQD